MAKPSLYRRELKYVEKLFLVARFQNHLPSKHGLYGKDRREQLLWLAKTKWQEDLNIDPFLPSDEPIDKKYDQALYSWFQEVRDRAKTGLLDIKMICDLLTDDQLEKIFSPLSDEEKRRLEKAQVIAEKAVSGLKDEEKRLLYQQPPIARKDFKTAAMLFKALRDELKMPIDTGYSRADLQTILETILTSSLDVKTPLDRKNWKDALAIDMISIALRYLGPRFQADIVHQTFKNTADLVGAQYYHPYAHFGMS